MSRTTAKDIVESPCERFLEWGNIYVKKIVDDEEITQMKGGTFFSYDKELKKKVPVELPFDFAILEPDLVTFKGYDEKNKRGVYSNEVKDKEHVVYFRSKEGILLKFKKKDYKEHKDAIKGFGGKFTQSIYIAVKVEGTWKIWNLQLNGASLTGGVDFENKKEEEALDGWINFTSRYKQGNKIYTNYIGVTGFKPKKKGATRFTIPVYELGAPIANEDAEQLNALDEKLKEYLAYKFAYNPEAGKPEKEPAAVVAETEDIVTDEGEKMPWE